MCFVYIRIFLYFVKCFRRHLLHTINFLKGLVMVCFIDLASNNFATGYNGADYDFYIDL